MATAKITIELSIPEYRLWVNEMTLHLRDLEDRHSKSKPRTAGRTALASRKNALTAMLKKVS